MSRLEEVLHSFDNILLVADENTYNAAGEKTENYIGNKIKNRKIFSGKTVMISDEIAINATKEALVGCDFILCIGSGVIQNLCKFVSYNCGKPYAIVATAPSMDGYASNGAAMIAFDMAPFPYNKAYSLLKFCDERKIPHSSIVYIDDDYG